MKSFKQYLTESEEVNNRIDQVTSYMESKRKRIPIDSGEHLLASVDASKSPYANDFHGHGSKSIKGTVTLLHGMGDVKKGLHTMPWNVPEGAAAGFGASRPYTNTPTGFIFHKSKPHHAIGMYVHPESGLQDHFKSLVPEGFPVIGTHEIRSFLDSSGKKVNKQGQYEGPKIDVFGRTRNQQS
jgi:hypothetical protein